MSGRFISYIRYISIPEGIKGDSQRWKVWKFSQPPFPPSNMEYILSNLYAFGIKEQKIFLSLPNWTT